MQRLMVAGALAVLSTLALDPTLALAQGAAHVGRWSAPHPGHRWVPARWQRAGHEWHFAPGHWRRA